MSNRAYIDLNPLLNTRAYIKEALTDKGDGKTTALIITAFKSRLATGLTPVVCRRWGTEMGEQFKNDVLEKLRQFLPEEFSKRVLIWQGNLKKGGLYLVDKNDKNARAYIHAFPLSMVGKMKSGLDVATHRNIYIDEYVPMDGRYLPNEAELILELYRTVDRDALLYNDPYLNYILICGNRIGRAPATDIYFGINHNYAKNSLSLYKNESYAILTYANSAHVEKIKTSRFDDLLQGTAYQKYARGGELNPTTPQLWLKALPAHSVYICYNNVWAQVYYLPKPLALIFKSIAKPPTADRTTPRFTCDPTDNTGCMWVKRVDPFCRMLRTYFANGRIYYIDRRTAELHADTVEYLAHC